MIKAPVLLIIFNRPDTTQEVFNAIRKARPPKLYVASDGARADRPDEVAKVNEARRIATEVDWDCELHTKFEEQNLGCGPGPKSGISWVFENEDRAIILEDDCIPAQSFFPYCDELLERYKDDERVWTISGDNFYEEVEMPYSYVFSNYGHSWGWATWKRCWEHFDPGMSGLTEFLSLGGFENVFVTRREGRYFNKLYAKFINSQTLNKHVWDFQANFVAKSNRGLSIVPSRNLVSNIGVYGTHSGSEGKYHNRVVDEEFRITTHPRFFIPFHKYETHSFMRHYADDRRILRRVRRKFHKILGQWNRE